MDATLQNSLTDAASAKTSIGIPPSGTDTPGTLVLEDTNKSMILPKVASPNLNIINPEPGTLVYDTVYKTACSFQRNSMGVLETVKFYNKATLFCF